MNEHFKSIPGNFHRPDCINEPLYVITTVFNPARYRSRWKLGFDFEDMVLRAGAHLYVVEASFGERNQVVVEQKSDKHTIIHIQTVHEIWHKEAMINIGISHLPDTWKYVAWMDNDIAFIREDWVGETLHKLQHHHIVQMFSIATDVTPDYEPYAMSTGFVHDWIHGVPEADCYGNQPPMPVNPWHTGYAWAARRQAIVDLGGLIDFAILGSADNHMARCLIGKCEKSVNLQVHQEYKNALQEWQNRCDRYIMKNIGYVKGGIIHYWHGKKQFRGYKDRWKILVEHGFQPSLDLKKDWNGLWQLTDRVPELRLDIQNYFGFRNEDDISTTGLKSFAERDTSYGKLRAPRKSKK